MGLNIIDGQYKSWIRITCECNIHFVLTTSEKATESDPRRIENAAPYLLFTTMAMKAQERAPRKPERIRYDLRLYPKSGMESLKEERSGMLIR